jgi:hypothetical protein
MSSRPQQSVAKVAVTVWPSPNPNLAAVAQALDAKRVDLIAIKRAPRRRA